MRNALIQTTYRNDTTGQFVTRAEWQDNKRRNTPVHFIREPSRDHTGRWVSPNTGKRS